MQKNHRTLIAMLNATDGADHTVDGHFFIRHETVNVGEGFAEAKVLYHYSTPIAVRLTHSGRKVVNTTRESKSTSRLQSAVLQAWPDARQVFGLSRGCSVATLLRGAGIIAPEHAR